MAKWTVMVFMGTAHPSLDKPLTKEAAEDIAEMSKVEPDDDSLNILVQLHGEGIPRRLHVRGSDIEEQQVDVAESDVTDGRALGYFIDWALKKANHQADQDYALLILWGHAFRFAVSHVTTPTGVDALDFAELSRVLGGATKSLGRKLHIIGFDACDLATIEVANRLQPCAEFLVASQIKIPLPGWPYHLVFRQLRDSRQHSLMDPENLGEYIVRRFCEDYFRAQEVQSVSLTLLDLRQAEEAFRRTEALASSILDVRQDQTEMDTVVEMLRRSKTARDKPFVDMAALCLNLSRECKTNLVKDAARNLGDFLVRPRDVGGSDRGSFIVEHGRNSHETAMLQGVSVYAPPALEGLDFESIKPRYDLLAGDTIWNLVVHALVLSPT